MKRGLGEFSAHVFNVPPNFPRDYSTVYMPYIEGGSCFQAKWWEKRGRAVGKDRKRVGQRQRWREKERQREKETERQRARGPLGYAYIHNEQKKNEKNVAHALSFFGSLGVQGVVYVRRWRECCGMT